MLNIKNCADGRDFFRKLSDDDGIKYARRKPCVSARADYYHAVIVPVFIPIAVTSIGIDHVAA